MFSLLHQTITSMAMHGNAFILVDKDRQGRPIQLTPVHPEKVKVAMQNSQKVYMLQTTKGSYDRKITSNNMLHFVWYSYPGQLVGVSPLRTNSNTYGLLWLWKDILHNFMDKVVHQVLYWKQIDLTAEQANILKETWINNHNKNRNQQY